jgi:hypothetical protein
MNEKEFGGKVADLLKTGLDSINDSTAAKLKSARLEALARYDGKARVTGLVLAGTNGGRFGGLFSQRPMLWAPIVAALLAIAISGYWQYSQNDVTDDIDAFLLAGDLPIRAYIDKDFEAWLKGYSR